ncbi:MAG: zonular occludens toxin domain-containing protein [Arcobacter sp.]|jgi:zona occludens toxin|uniref:zonular occludens toxin domain-containing protein n=1 Tax=Arcobacter sp. TaxID=1872629 RepID=UPI002A763F58|nr:zonular occludens toxin domain-containing protein [Arcobacter sp.]MDY3204474.1 zonular occludens toxin domain-containing protein [Arcobacter sp.]
MAITFYTGIPRSGKSLKAVAKIYHTFVTPKLSKLDTYLIKKGIKKPFVNPYENCYTNINQFNFEISPLIFKFDFDEIYNKLNELYVLYMAKKSDEELIEKAKELNIYKSLFVIDECHNYLKSKENPVLVWWFTYHGHLFQDIILITQDLKLVNDEYKRVAEFFYKAVPQRLRVSKNVFKYRSFSSYQMYQKDLINTETLKVIPEYFNLYVSGDSPKSKSIIHKFIFIMLILFLITPFLVYKFIDNLNQDNEIESITPPAPQNKLDENSQLLENKPLNDNQIITSAVEPIQNLKLFKFNCFDKFCYYKIDKKSTIEIPMNILKSFLMNIDEDKKFTEIKNNRLYIYALVDETKFNFMNKGVTNENEKNNTNILPTVGLN